jgi:hypothetical protein
MEAFRTALDRVVAKAAAQERLLSTMPTSTVRPPRTVDLYCDVELQSLFSAWVPTSGKREIVRALTCFERTALTQRAGELQAGLAPYAASERSAVKAGLLGMFSGFRNMRLLGADLEATVEILLRVLREFPLWAIRRGCLRIAQCKAGLDGKWPPNDAEVYAVVAEEVRFYRAILASVEALLDTPIEAARAQQRAAEPLPQTSAAP